MRIQRIGIWSLGKIFALLAGITGLVVGLVTAINYLYFVGHFPTMEELNQIPLVIHFFGGPLSVFSLPLCYATGGLIGGAFLGSVYNVTARWFGGVHVEIGQDPRLFTADFD